METKQQTTKPKIWKLMIIAWIFAYIIVSIVFAILGPYIIKIHPLLRTAIITTLLVPTFGLGIPLLQKKFYKWTIK